MKEPRFYNLTPAKGQALLNFQGRRMPDTVELFETTVVEEVRQKKNASLLDAEKQKELNSDFRNLLIHGDCLSACAYLKSQNIKVDLVYIDPPFASGANYAKKISLRNGGKTHFDTEDACIGEEIMYGDIWQKEDYLNWLYERILAIKNIMSDQASIFLHLDWHIGYYVKILLDEVFGEENFRNEIIVKRIKKNVRERELVKTLNNATDMIYVYAIGDEVKYLPPMKEEEKDERWHSFEAAGFRKGMDYELFGFYPAVNNHWRWELPKTKAAIRNYELWKEKFANKKTLTEYWVETGEKLDFIRKHSKTGKPEYFIPASEETLCDSLWDDISAYSFQNEYSTEKSEDLLERILNTNSNTSDFIVADLFCGSGVTAKVANDLGKKFISCDIGVNAIQTTRDRLVETGAEFDLLKINDGVRLFRNPAQTAAKIFSLVDGFKNRIELGLGDFWDGGIAGSKGSFLPLKFIGLDKKLTKQLVDVILEEIYQIEESSEDAEGVKIIYATKELDVDQNYINAEIRKSGKSNLKVELISLDDLLGQKADMLFTPDNAEVEMKKDGKWWKVEIKQYFSSYLKAKVDEFNSKKVKKQSDDELFDEKESNAGTKTKQRKITISKSGLELIESVQFDTTLKKNVWTSDLDVEDKAGIKDKIRGVYRLNTNKFKMKIRNIAGDEIVIDSEELERKK
ncbi:MAG: DNA methyltransferase [Bacteroidota bacterium]